MTKKTEGVVRVAVPFIVMGICGLVGWGGHQERLKNHGIEIETKVSIEVFEAEKESDQREHDQMIKNQEIMQADLKELLRK